MAYECRRSLRLAYKKSKSPKRGFFLERVNGIEPSYAAWEAAVLPLNYTRIGVGFYVISTTLDQAAIF